MDMCNDQRTIHFSKTTINTDVHCTEKESIALLPERECLRYFQEREIRWIEIRIKDIDKNHPSIVSFY